MSIKANFYTGVVIRCYSPFPIVRFFLMLQVHQIQSRNLLKHKNKNSYFYDIRLVKNKSFYLGGRKTDFRLYFCFAKLLTLGIIKVNLVSTLV